MDGNQIARDYARDMIRGWEDTNQPGLAKRQFNLLGDSFTPFGIAGQTRVYTGRKTFLFDVVKSVLGHYTPVYVQQVGDCVSWGMKNAIEYLTCCQIAGLAASQTEMSFGDFIAAARLKWRPLFAPYYYGTGRVYIGNNSLRGDGSLGSWMIEAVKRFGSLFADQSGVPEYSAEIARLFGRDKASLDKWLDIADDYPVKSSARITTWEQYCQAIHNGYPVTMASNIGYSMEPGRDGFHVQNAAWSHQMCGVGADETWSAQYGIILNQWGDVHGELKDFQTGEALPPGIIRAKRADIEKHLKYGECYAPSGFEGYPEQRLDKALFLLLN